MALAVEAEGLTKRFGSVVALEQVDLAVDEGVVHGLVGPNGAGKTTLLSVLLGLAAPDGGNLRVLGLPACGEAGGDRVAGFVESPRFYPYLSGWRNLKLLARLDGGGGEGEGEIDDLLALVGLGEVAHEKVKGYSLGMRQRLGLAAALLRAPGLLVLDEPTNGLDPAAGCQLRALLSALAAEGRTVLLSSHRMTEIEDVCDSVTVLRTGRVAFDGTLAAMRSRAPAPAYHVTTSDDDAALALAWGRRGRAPAAVRHERGGLAVRAAQDVLDGWVIRLGRAGVAVRSMALEATSLESLFLSLTEQEP